MRNQLAWKIPGETFEDGSRLADWKKIASFPWQWQYDTHELAFDIYEHNGGYWKLYRAHELQIPVLVVWRKYDRFINVKLAYEIAEKLPNAKLEVIDKSGHYVHMDKPQELVQVVTKFLHEAA